MTQKDTVEEHNIIDGEKCCWRCGLPQKDARASSGCYVGWGSYPRHLWKTEAEPFYTKDNNGVIHLTK